MNIMKNIPRLPIEMKCYIYNYIDIDTRIELMIHVCGKRTFLEYMDAIPTEKNVKLFEIFIRNKLLMCNQRSASDYKLWYMKSTITKLLPYIKYKINSRQHIMRNEIYNVIVRHANIEYIPRRFNNYTPNRLDWKRQLFIREHAENIYNVFSTFECGRSHEKFKYFIKKILLYYMISIIMNGKERALQERTKKTHAQIKCWLKRTLPKPLKQAVKKYEKRAIKRVREEEKRTKKRIKEEAKIAKQRAKEKVKQKQPNIIIIKRKRILKS